ncbi:MAG: GNAT family N-acetyltransferase [Acidimicrobiales bacterium]
MRDAEFSSPHLEGDVESRSAQMAAHEVVLTRLDPDGETAVRLLASYYGELDERFPEGFDLEVALRASASDLMPPSGVFYGLAVAAVWSGCGAVRRLDDETWEVKSMWIAPTIRGRGAGRLLLETLEAFAGSHGGRSIRLDTSRHLPEAIALYLRAGYTECAPYNDNVFADFWFEKRLVPLALDRRFDL